MKKAEIIQVLLEEYGYDNEQELTKLAKAELEALLKKEETAKAKVEQEETIEHMSDDYHDIKDEDLVQVMNGRNGELIHRSSRTGRMWKFTRFGQVDKMPFSEIMNIWNLNPRCFEEGRLIILNGKVAENFNLTETYKRIIKPKDLDSLFTKSVEDLKEIVADLPSESKSTFIYRAKELYSQGKIDSKKLIEFVEEQFGISLEDNAPKDELV